MQLTANFSLAEFLRSQTARRRGREIVPPPEVIKNLQRLAIEILQPLRYSLRAPIVVTSGYRPEWLNAAIGGRPGSSHLLGLAADIEVPGFRPQDVAERVLDLGLPVDQCIHEYPPHGWVHVSIAAEGAKPRDEYLTARYVDGRTEYTQGIHA